MIYKNIIRPILFNFDAEEVHHFAFNSMKFAMGFPGVKALSRAIFGQQPAGLAREVFGIKFPSPVGLAAGFDKDAELIEELATFGFGFIEIGTLTPKGQPGNPKPRLFRLPADEGLVNRLGFNNQGVEAAIERLRDRLSHPVVGGNIGKNKDTPNHEAVSDYLKGFKALFPYVDYFAVNVSSPNTPNLRQLQEKEPLLELLNRLQDENSKQQAPPKPILLKIAPDLNHSQLDDILEIVDETKISGLIATNTTIARNGLRTPAEKVRAIGQGGLSGRPLAGRSNEVIAYLHQQSGGKVDIVGVGGIMSPADAVAKLEAGAKLVQLYTGFVYGGPSLIGEINRAVLKSGC